MYAVHIKQTLSANKP